MCKAPSPPGAHPRTEPLPVFPRLSSAVSSSTRFPPCLLWKSPGEDPTGLGCVTTALWGPAGVWAEAEQGAGLSPDGGWGSGRGPRGSCASVGLRPSPQSARPPGPPSGARPRPGLHRPAAAALSPRAACGGTPHSDRRFSAEMARPPAGCLQIAAGAFDCLSSPASSHVLTPPAPARRGGARGHRHPTDISAGDPTEDRLCYVPLDAGTEEKPSSILSEPGC